MIAILNINQIRKDANAKNMSKIRHLKNADFQMLENSPLLMMKNQLPRVSRHLLRHQLKANKQSPTAAAPHLNNNCYLLKNKKLKLYPLLLMMI